MQPFGPVFPAQKNGGGIVAQVPAESSCNN